MAMARMMGSIACSMRSQIIRNGVELDGRDLICDALPPKQMTWKEKYEKFGGPNWRFENGRDYQHWFIHLAPLRGPRPPIDGVISYYVDTLSKVLPRDEAVNKIYSVSTKQGYAFGANISPEQADAIKENSNVTLIAPDEYFQNPSQKTKTYPLDPFINGQALPHDPKRYPDLLLCALRSDEASATIGPYKYAK